MGIYEERLFLCLKEIENKLNNSELQCSLKEEELDYNTLFNSKVYSMVTSGKTSELIEEYEKKYSELLEKSLYMQKGVIDHNNYANISDSLGNNGFFGVKKIEITTCCKRWKYISNAENAGWIEWVNKKRKEQVLNTKD